MEVFIMNKLKKILFGLVLVIGAAGSASCDQLGDFLQAYFKQMTLLCGSKSGSTEEGEQIRAFENGLIKDFAQVQSRFGENRDLRSRQIKEFAGTVVLAKKAIAGNAKEFDRKKFKQMMLNLDIFVAESRGLIALKADSREGFKKEIINIDRSLCALKTELLDFFERAAITKFGKMIAGKAEKEIEERDLEIEALKKKRLPKAKVNKVDTGELVKLKKDLALAKENVEKSEKSAKLNALKAIKLEKEVEKLKEKLSKILEGREEKFKKVQRLVEQCDEKTEKRRLENVKLREEIAELKFQVGQYRNMAFESGEVFEEVSLNDGTGKKLPSVPNVKEKKVKLELLNEKLKRKAKRKPTGGKKRKRSDGKKAKKVLEELDTNIGDPVVLVK
jgi:hypothetical protein